jgi:hypothetical protein
MLQREIPEGVNEAVADAAAKAGIPVFQVTFNPRPKTLNLKRGEAADDDNAMKVASLFF